MGPVHFGRANRQFARKSNINYGFARIFPRFCPNLGPPPRTPMLLSKAFKIVNKILN